MRPSPSEILLVAEAAAREAAAFLREQEGTQDPSKWTEKGRADFVTEVDRESERMITVSLRRAFPDCEVIGEELNPSNPSSSSNPSNPSNPLVFIVDPLDGTTNFLHRYPYYAVSIGALNKGELVAGVVHHVVPGITYTAAKNLGAFQNGKPITVSNVSNPSLALIGTGYPFKAIDQMPRYLKHFDAIMRSTSGIRRAGSAALDLCDVAAGRFDGFWELVLAPWDIAAGALIVREAGGIITGFDGDPDVIRHGPIVAGNGIIHAWLMNLLREVG